MVEPTEAVKGAGLVAMLVPDTTQAKTYGEIESNLGDGATLLFAHGFNIHFKQIQPRGRSRLWFSSHPRDPGIWCARQYEQGRGVPCLIAVAQDASGSAQAKALAYAHGIGGARAGVLETTFGEETETDLFGEQAVLCGGATELVVKGFETLVEAGYQPEVAYFECMHELKLITDLLHEGRDSKDAPILLAKPPNGGDLTRGPRVINSETKDRMKEILTEIQDGRFADEWVKENQAGQPRYKELLEEDLDRQLESVGRELRGRMSWLSG